MKAIAFHVQHDANLAIADDGRLLLALELEKLFEERYFASASDDETFRAQWAHALKIAREATGIDEFDIAVTSWVMPAKRRILQSLVSARQWSTVDHHVAHALHGLHDSPFSQPLVVSFDGGGNDGTFRIFRGDRQRGLLTAVARPPLNLGTPYRLLATAMPEVTGRKPQPRAGHLSLAGKLMAYAALAAPRADWFSAVEDYYRAYQEPAQALYSLGEALKIELDADSLSADEARALAATSQAVFESLVEQTVLEHLHAAPVDGIILTGGCALNVVANERLRHTSRRPIHIPPAPNDAGIAVGALWSVGRPIGEVGPFVGLDLVRDVEDSRMLARGARRTAIEELAPLVLRGAIIGIAHGRMELGPRALGNRSIIAAPDRPELRERINARIKSREWYRPVAPAVLADTAMRLFENPPRSPYMSFAARVRESERRRLAGAVHIDGTARVQIIENPASPLGALLVALQRLGATPCVLNTSFNMKGQPLLRRASAALDILDATELDFAWIEGWLIPGSTVLARKAASA